MAHMALYDLAYLTFLPYFILSLLQTPVYTDLLTVSQISAPWHVGSLHLALHIFLWFVPCFLQASAQVSPPQRGFSSVK